MEIVNIEKAKTVRAEIYQPFACYREPLVMSGFITSLPLPPPTTIAGMLVHAMDEKFEDWIDIAVIGKAESFMVDYQRLVKEPEKYHRTGTHKPSPARFQVLTNVNLTVFIKGGNLNKICDALNNPKNYLSLGRKEDTAFVPKGAEIVEVRTIKVSLENAIKNDIILENTYIPFTKENSDIGYYYRLSKRYKSLDERDFEFDDYLYVSERSKFIAGEFCMYENKNKREFFRWMVIS